MTFDTIVEMVVLVENSSIKKAVKKYSLVHIFPSELIDLKK